MRDLVVEVIRDSCGAVHWTARVFGMEVLMARHALLTIVILAGILCGTPAIGQHIYGDTNRDGTSDDQDRLQAKGTTDVDIWLVTDRSRDASPVPLLASAQPLSIFSYELSLGVVGGTVAWGRYANALESLDTPLGLSESPTEFYVGFAGTRPLPPGKYRLGTLSLEVLTGDPKIEFRSQSGIHHLGYTSFGSLNDGKDGDYTLKLARDPSRVSIADPGEPRDWADADGVASPSAGAALASEVRVDAAPRFAVVVGSNPGGRTSGRLSVTTTRQGYLRIRIFDLQGRLVRELASGASAPAGSRTFELHTASAGRTGLASGLYLYKVEASEGTRTGRIILVR